MGIDAEILLRVKGEKPTEDQLTAWSWQLGRSVGAERFLLSDGLEPEAYRRAKAAWHAQFNAHPLYPEYEALRTFDSQRQVHEKILADLPKLPEQRQRAIELTNAIYPLDDECYADYPPAARQPGRCWTQDGDPIFAEAGEWFLEVSVWTRYYDIGYERGDLLTLCAIAEWCEANIPGVEVWYGGDSSGVCAAPWPDAARAKLRQHLYSQAGRDYFEYDRHMSAFGGSAGPKPPPCSLCVGQGHFNQYGTGPSYIAVNCGGCGKSFVSRDHGKTWTDEKEKA